MVDLASAGVQSAQVGKRRSFLSDVLVRLVKEKPLGTICGVIFLLMLLVGIFANFLAPYGYNDTNPLDSLARPSSKHILGADNLGRDLLSRVIYGARISMTVGFSASTLSLAIAAAIGILTGFFGGKFDIVVQRFVDAWMCFPGLVVLIAVISLIGPGLGQVILVLGVGSGISGSRVVRSAVISVRQNVYIDGVKAVGCPTGRTVIRHIVPNIAAPMIIMFTTGLPQVIMAESTLSFLGYGIPAPMPSWGGMLSGAGRSFMFLAPWLAIWPGLALSIVVYSVNMFGDAIRDVLDPRLRGGLGSYTNMNSKLRKRLASKTAL